MELKSKLLTTVFVSLIFWSSQINAEDSVITRNTLAGLSSIYVLVENIQPNIQKYARKAELNSVQLKKEIESQLNASGIKTMSRDEWLKAPGRPVLYININTHETEKYWYAYDIKLELRQIVYLEINPKVKTLADTWSINITGVANIGNLNVIKKDEDVLLDRFIQAYKSVNGLK
jgi:hypothetical protein